MWAELPQVLDAVQGCSYDEGKKSVVGKTNNGEPIYPYRHLQCRICGKPMLEALIDNTSEVGLQIIEAIGPPVH